MTTGHGHLAEAARVLNIEAEAVAAAAAGLDDSFSRAVDAILGARGKTIVTGLGKSGHIGRKLAATLASTGTPALFLHAGEATHGDVGMLTAGDILLALSYSGSSEDLNNVLAYAKNNGIPVIALTSNSTSRLAREADLCVHVAVQREACPLNLAPTASALATLAVGDALAMALLTARGFTPDDFARTHPSGNLGRRLLRVADLMITGQALPLLPATTPILEAIVTMSSKRLGMVLAATPTGQLAGIFTDGDLRRCIERGPDLAALTLSKIMNPSPVTIGPQRLAAAAAEVMRARKVNQLPVLEDDRLVGALTIQMVMHYRPG